MSNSRKCYVTDIGDLEIVMLLSCGYKLNTYTHLFYPSIIFRMIFKNFKVIKTRNVIRTLQE